MQKIAMYAWEQINAKVVQADMKCQTEFVSFFVPMALLCMKITEVVLVFHVLLIA